jgi:dimethylamine/trimethylamine dehydrogenase
VLLARRLHDLGVTVDTAHLIVEFKGATGRGHSRVARKTTVQFPADAVVLTTQRVPRNGLYRDIVANESRRREEGISRVYRVGDCLAPRPQVADAIFDGHRLAREIESGNPAHPQPWVREHRYLGRTDREYDSIVDDTDSTVTSERPSVASRV